MSKGSIRRAGKESVDIDLPADQSGRALLEAHESAGVICQAILGREQKRRRTGW